MSIVATVKRMKMFGRSTVGENLRDVNGQVSWVALIVIWTWNAALSNWNVSFPRWDAVQTKHRDENVHYHMILTATTQIEYQKTRQMFEQKTQQKIQDYILQKNSEIGGIQTGVERSERTNCEKGVGDGTNAPADHRSRTKARKACEGSGGVN